MTVFDLGFDDDRTYSELELLPVVLFSNQHFSINASEALRLYRKGKGPGPWHATCLSCCFRTTTFPRPKTWGGTFPTDGTAQRAFLAHAAEVHPEWTLTALEADYWAPLDEED